MKTRMEGDSIQVFGDTRMLRKRYLDCYSQTIDDCKRFINREEQRILSLYEHEKLHRIYRQFWTRIWFDENGKPMTTLIADARDKLTQMEAERILSLYQKENENEWRKL